MMQAGRWYEVRHQNDAQRKARRSTLQYLETTEFMGHAFSARPTAGTQHLQDEEIISVVEISRPDRPVVGEIIP